MTTHPRFPIFIPSKSRAAIATTPAALNTMGVAYRIIVEESQFDEYAAHWGEQHLLVLDPVYQDEYETCEMEEPVGLSKGAGPARNFAWDTAIAEGHDWHWVMDDNIRDFQRFNRNQFVRCGDGTPFHVMETFALRYNNIGMVGPDYAAFVVGRKPPGVKPFRLNHRVFSCNLIRNDIALRWRCRYNEDLILTLDMLKAGWCTVTFLAYLQNKAATQSMPGGNTEAFYSIKGTLPKSQMAVREHPDVVRLAHRFGRWHHVADMRRFQSMKLIPKPDPEPVPGYRTTRITR